MKNCLVIAILLLITGCGSVSLKDVAPKLSQKIRLDRVPKHQKTVYLRIQDESGNATDIATSIQIGLDRKGYSTVPDGDPATYKLFVKILKFSEGSPSDYPTYDSKASRGKYADRCAIAEIEVFGPGNKTAKTRIMVGVNFSGSLKSAPAELVEFSWEKLERSLSKAIVGLF